MGVLGRLAGGSRSERTNSIRLLRLLRTADILAGSGPVQASAKLPRARSALPGRVAPPTRAARGRCASLLAAAANSDDPLLRMAAARHPLCPPPLRLALRLDPLAVVRWTVPASFVGVSADSPYDVRLAAAGHESCPPQALRCLAADPNSVVRAVAAANPACPAPAVMRLARDGECNVRHAVAENPSAPAEALSVLSVGGDHEAETRLAANPATSVKALWQLAGSGACREALAENRSSPVEMLERLAARECMHTERCDGDSCRRKDEAFYRVIAGLVSNPSTPQRVLDQIHGDDSDGFDVCAGLARGSEDPDVLAAQAGSSNRAVLKEVAGNRHADADTLRRLKRDDNGESVWWLLPNPACPSDVLAAVVRDEPMFHLHVTKNPNCPPELLAELAASSDAAVRRMTAKHRDCPASTLAALANDPLAMVVKAAAANPRCPDAAALAAEHAGNAAPVAGGRIAAWALPRTRN